MAAADWGLSERNPSLLRRRAQWPHGCSGDKCNHHRVVSFDHLVRRAKRVAGFGREAEARHRVFPRETLLDPIRNLRRNPIDPLRKLWADARDLPDRCYTEAG